MAVSLKEVYFHFGRKLHAEVGEIEAVYHPAMHMDRHQAGIKPNGVHYGMINCKIKHNIWIGNSFMFTGLLFLCRLLIVILHKNLLPRQCPINADWMSLGPIKTRPAGVDHKLRPVPLTVASHKYRYTALPPVYGRMSLAAVNKSGQHVQTTSTSFSTP